MPNAKPMTKSLRHNIQSGKLHPETAVLIADTITTNTISYDLLRKIGKATHSGMQEKLDYGCAIIEGDMGLEQYWYSYAPMIQRQWEFVSPKIKLPAGDLEIVDYGCGQGGASALFLDQFRETHHVTQVTLIEPSVPALKSACEIVQCYLPDADITAVPKKLDDLIPTDGPPQTDTIRVHIFSNILDVPGFSIERLADTVAHNFSGTKLNYILAVSHNRNFRGGIERFNSMQALLEKNSVRVPYKASGEFSVEMSWGGTSDAIYFILCLGK